MAQAAALMIGFFVLWMTVSAGRWPAVVALTLAVIAAALAVFAAARMGTMDREGVRLFARPVQPLLSGLARSPQGFAAAFGVVASALGVRRAKAGFLRLKLRNADGAALENVIEALSAAPGVVVVDADAGSLLAHAHDEEAADVASLQALAQRARGGVREATP